MGVPAPVAPLAGTAEKVVAQAACARAGLDGGPGVAVAAAAAAGRGRGLVARRRRGTSVVGSWAASVSSPIAVASAAPVVAAAAIVSSSSSSSSSSSAAVAAGRAGGTASPAPASASASAIFAVVDAARASHDVRAVHGLHSLRRRVGVGEGDEAEAPGPPGLPVGDDLVVREGRRGRGVRGRSIGLGFGLNAR